MTPGRDPPPARVALISYRLRRESGESRLTLNLARGLRARGIPVVVVAIAASPQIRAEYAAEGLDLRVEGRPWGTRDDWQAMAYRPGLAARVGRLLRQVPPAEVYLVVQDAALPVVAEHLPGRTAFLCQGDMQLLLLDAGFRSAHRLGSAVLARSLPKALAHRADWVRRFDVVLANSEFTRGLMSFLYDLAVEGVVYPPVDVERFASDFRSGSAEKPFALAVLKSAAEPGFPAVARLARRVPVRVIGKAEVPGAETLGVIADPALIAQYRAARLTLSPSFREFFGYALVESMACGTPCVAFDQGGAREIIHSGVDGWLVRRDSDLEETVVQRMRDPPSAEMRARAVTAARRFSIEASTEALVTRLGLA